MTYEVAPMEGVTDAVYRRVHSRIFGGADRYWSPFWSPTQVKTLSTRAKRELLPENNRGITLVPQVMTKSPEDFLWAARLLREVGYEEINLNLGCPSGTVTAKGKGAGALRDLTTLEDFLTEIFSESVLPISIKTRMGIADSGEFGPLLDLYRRFPLKSLTVHARVMKDRYVGPLRPEGFSAALDGTPFPVILNGDIHTPADIRRYEANWPEAAGLMVGRALMADPALLRKARGGAAAGREELLQYSAGLFDGYTEAFGGGRSAMARMKEHWRYLILNFDDREKLSKEMRKTTDVAWYRTLTERAVRELPLRESPDFDW